MLDALIGQTVTITTTGGTTYAGKLTAVTDGWATVSLQPTPPVSGGTGYVQVAHIAGVKVGG